MLGSLPFVAQAVVTNEVASDKKTGEFLEFPNASIGLAATTGWNFYDRGKISGKHELLKGSRHLHLSSGTFGPDGVMQIDQIVHGTFNSLKIARITRDSFYLWCRLGYS